MVADLGGGISAPILIVASLIGAAGGGVSGLLGIGGAAILSPLLQLLLGCSQYTAQGLSLAVILPPVGIPALLAYRRAGVRLAWGTIATLGSGFVVFAYVGGRTAQVVPELALRLMFLVFLLVSAFRVWRSTRASVQPEATAEQLTPVAVTQSHVTVAGIGAVAGFASGLMGIGGGILLVPALRRYCGMSRLQAQATTLAMMLPPVGLPAVMVYATKGIFAWPLLLTLVAGFVVGSYAGGRVSTQIQQRTAARILVGVMLVLASALALRI
jgi:uncharacterized protein